MWEWRCRSSTKTRHCLSIITSSALQSRCHLAPVLTHCACAVTQEAAFLFVCLFKTITHITITLLYNTACVSLCISLHDRFHVSIGKMSNHQLSAFKASFTFILCCSCVVLFIRAMISNKLVCIIISHSNNISRSGNSSCCRCCRSLVAIRKSFLKRKVFVFFSFLFKLPSSTKCPLSWQENLLKVQVTHLPQRWQLHRLLPEQIYCWKWCGWCEFHSFYIHVTISWMHL